MDNYLSGMCSTSGDFLGFSDEMILMSGAIVIDPSKQLLLTLYKPSHSVYYFTQTTKSPYEISDEAILRSVSEDTGLVAAHLHLPHSCPDSASLLGLKLDGEMSRLRSLPIIMPGMVNRWW